MSLACGGKGLRWLLRPWVLGQLKVAVDEATRKAKGEGIVEELGNQADLRLCDNMVFIPVVAEYRRSPSNWDKQAGTRTCWR